MTQTHSTEGTVYIISSITTYDSDDLLLTLKYNFMNLLSYKNRFDNIPCTDRAIAEANGYTQCLSDVMDYLKEVTEFNPAKRMIDAVCLIDSISETNAAMIPKFQQLNNDLKKEKTLIEFCSS